LTASRPDLTVPRQIIAGQRRALRRTAMQWTTPRIVEITVGLEINSYACADL
jgi:coenzyme PQQ precursor peptide PqqA